MDYEQIIQDILHVYASNCGQKLTNDDALEILCALLSERDTASILETSPRHLLQIVFENNKFYNKCVFPCDIVELRNFLDDGCIKTQSKIVLFSNSCAERVIKDKKLKFVVKCDPQKLCATQGVSYKTFGGITIVDANCLDITNMVEHFIVQSKGYDQVATVEKIVKDFELNIPVYTTSIIAGIDKYKFANTKRNYAVYLKPFGIKGKSIARANNEVEALEMILQMRWAMHPDSDRGRVPRPERYYAEYWQKSGFLPSMVKKAADNLSIKEADASSGSQYGTGGRMAGEGSTMDYEGVRSLQRYEPGASAAISKGDIFVSKDAGIMGQGRKYRVLKIYNNNTVMLQDEAGKKLMVDISVELPTKFRKV